MNLYSGKDMQDARRGVQKYACLTAMVLLPMLAVYVFVLVKGVYALTLVMALMMLIWLLLAGDLLLKPRLHYARFLKEMNGGLRRQAICIPEDLSDDIQLQDGVRVRSLQVRLCDGGESRIFYVNASKTEFLPQMNVPIALVSWGRHITGFVEI